ncbi:MAG: hypothetical protein KDJ52_34565 [Anaerolineae bacterium]|nr:hypothetical protein [Anaerolineae bacterium]
MSDEQQTRLTQESSSRRFRDYVARGFAVIIVLGMIIMMITAMQTTVNAESPEQFPQDWGYSVWGQSDGYDSDGQAADVGILDEPQMFFPILYISGGGSAPANAEIGSISGYTGIEQTETNFQVRLANHAEGFYDIYLTNSVNGGKICAGVIVDASGQKDVSCDLSAVAGGLLPPGLYDLFSTVSGTLAPKVAIAEFQVEIIARVDPALRFVGGNNRWAVGSAVNDRPILYQA